MVCGEYGNIFGQKIRTLSWLQHEKISRVLYVKRVFYLSIARALTRSEHVSRVMRARAQYVGIRGGATQFANTRHVTRCFNTGRTRFVTRQYALSRMALRRYIYLGKLPGVVKNTW